MLSPVFLLGILELILRCIEFGGYPGVLRSVGTIDNASLYITETKAASSYFIANKSRPGTMYENDFFIPKPPGTLRILVCGESAAKGFPQPRAFAASAFLELMLTDLLPGRKVEVINIATTAVASFPILGMLRDVLPCQPDVVVIYCGNNEFFGAYGVASLHSAGRSPLGMRIQRAFRSTAVAQFIEQFTQGAASTDSRTLMEAVMGKAYIAPNDPLRLDAARNLHENIAEMVKLCRSAGVPCIVCTPPCNERDMAPLGGDDLRGLSTDSHALFTNAFKEGINKETPFEKRAALLASAIKTYPTSALAHYQLGRLMYARQKYAEALREFQQAVDCDSMPWRPPAASVEAIRTAATENGAILCDLTGSFRAASEGGCCGSDLMDDHVHPSLRGQAIVARSLIKCISELSDVTRISPGSESKLGSWEGYAKQLGDNPYERYGVAHTLRVLCNVPFIRSTNPDFFDRFDKYCKDFEATLPPQMLEQARRWQDPKTHTGNIQRPISALMANVLVTEGKHALAEPLYACAIRNVPPYSSLNLDYSYFRLAALERASGTLGENARQEAQRAIERGKFLLSHGFAGSGISERFVGRLYQLRHEFNEAIPFLLEAHSKLKGKDRLAADQALVVSYVQTRQTAKARQFLLDMIKSNDPMADMYQQLLRNLDEHSDSQTRIEP
ncbi:MAG: tetratricopeptide repeat protein [Planctomycetota bacterium]